MESTTPHNSIAQRCTALLDLVAETRASVIFTRDGQPIARLEPFELRPTEGEAVLTLQQEDLFASPSTITVDDA